MHVYRPLTMTNTTFGCINEGCSTMSGDQVVKLAATIEVLTNAVQFLVAERVSMQPPSVHGALLQVLQRSLSAPAERDDAHPGGTAVQRAELAHWTPIIAATLIDDVRRQLGREPEGSPHDAAPQARTISETFSEMAERARRENARGSVDTLKAGPSAA
ncbi:hypothetical protein ACFZ8E_20280 [Methylobacterium sp. HMF5984]|uniref:hypothetical protein n=1 Tax=unclassified Methylobacterium TaxID=2615210 RepID=UPI001FBAC1A3|nr:hypothetical protein [Methylobacterium sp. E-016]MCJ2078329.1 hypothetical protein [Methylobacterium sp. E-016]